MKRVNGERDEREAKFFSLFLSFALSTSASSSISPLLPDVLRRRGLEPPLGDPLLRLCLVPLFPSAKTGAQAMSRLPAAIARTFFSRRSQCFLDPDDLQFFFFLLHPFFHSRYRSSLLAHLPPLQTPLRPLPEPPNSLPPPPRSLHGRGSLKGDRVLQGGAGQRVLARRSRRRERPAAVLRLLRRGQRGRARVRRGPARRVLK